MPTRSFQRYAAFLNPATCLYTFYLIVTSMSSYSHFLTVCKFIINNKQYSLPNFSRLRTGRICILAWLKYCLFLLFFFVWKFFFIFWFGNLFYSFDLQFFNFFLILFFRAHWISGLFLIFLLVYCSNEQNSSYIFLYSFDIEPIFSAVLPVGECLMKLVFSLRHQHCSF